MAIPLYFAANWKQFVYDPQKRPAQIGYGFRQDGTLRLPQRQIPDALCVIDDSILPSEPVAAEQLAMLADRCDHGCFLDFERPVHPFHIALIAALHGIAPLLVPMRWSVYAPEALAVLSCPMPCNSWQEFCRSASQRFPRGWALEVTPWQQRCDFPLGRTVSACFVRSALCRCKGSAEGLVYYDTGETLTEKLAVAEQLGCRCAVGLYEELAALL